MLISQLDGSSRVINITDLYSGTKFALVLYSKYVSKSFYIQYCM